jgi:hypothetical protein
LDDLRDEE